jgi:hypothetical protein
MWRVIIRVSYFHDHQSRLRNHIAALFAAMGLQNTNTGTWESARTVPQFLGPGHHNGFDPIRIWGLARAWLPIFGGEVRPQTGTQRPEM